MKKITDFVEIHHGMKVTIEHPVEDEVIDQIFLQDHAAIEFNINVESDIFEGYAYVTVDDKKKCYVEDFQIEFAKKFLDRIVDHAMPHMAEVVAAVKKQAAEKIKKNKAARYNLLKKELAKLEKELK